MQPIDPRKSALTHLLEPPAGEPRVVVVPLLQGRALSVESGADAARLSISDANGSELQIQIRFEAAGPCVSLRAHTLALEATENIVARCDTFTLEARHKIELQSGGEITQRAAGNAVFAARNVQLQAEAGSVQVRACDDVQLLGEKVLLNCDRPKPLLECIHEQASTDLTPMAPQQQASGSIAGGPAATSMRRSQSRASDVSQTGMQSSLSPTTLWMSCSG